MQVTATFADASGEVCRAYVVTLIGAGAEPIDYPARACRADGDWQLWPGF